MKCIRMDLTKEEYDKIKGFSYKELSDWVEDSLGTDIVCGYGYYGCSAILNSEDGGHYITYNRGDSCD